MRQKMQMSLEQLKAVKFSHNGFMDLPIVSQIDDELFVGACPQYWPAAWDHDHFPTIFNFYSSGIYVTGSCKKIDVRMLDSESPGDQTPTEQLIETANLVNFHRRDGLVLVHCQMGINRSNLIAAISLMLRGMAPDEAIKLLRQKRSPHVLMNDAFRQVIYSLWENGIPHA